MREALRASARSHHATGEEGAHCGNSRKRRALCCTPSQGWRAGVPQAIHRRRRRRRRPLLLRQPAAALRGGGAAIAILSVVRATAAASSSLRRLTPRASPPPRCAAAGHACRRWQTLQQLLIAGAQRAGLRQEVRLELWQTAATRARALRSNIELFCGRVNAPTR